MNISKACSDRLATQQALVGDYHHALLARIGMALADLRVCVQQMTPQESLTFAVDELMPLYTAFCALQDESLRKGDL